MLKKKLLSIQMPKAQSSSDLELQQALGKIIEGRFNKQLSELTGLVANETQITSATRNQLLAEIEQFESNIKKERDKITRLYFGYPLEIKKPNILVSCCA